jgi:hypothetical protein
MCGSAKPPGAREIHMNKKPYSKPALKKQQKLSLVTAAGGSKPAPPPP